MVGTIELKNLSLKEIDMVIKKLENDLDYCLNEKERNMTSILPQATKPKQDIVQSSRCEDKIIVYVITNEELDEKISSIQDQISNVRQYFDNELKRIGEYEPLIQKMISMRNKGCKLQDIADATDYSLSSVKRLLIKYYKKRYIC